ncbi:MAG: lipid-A-disaccharide synthase N-terminal domain-containing protein [Candidatus Aureabacteria bacterium]|nr:lipid-A-disaccharide synthase N-terminal domain-containing protein [Candidatus Auribacterota bacterium]
MITAWLIIGFLGQGIFASRFLVQWVVSEKQGKSVIPLAFWHLSLAGSVFLLSYAIHRKDAVFILGQISGIFVYSRNLYLIRKQKRVRLEAD